MKKKQKRSKLKTPKTVGDTLEEIKDKWFRPEMVRLLRLEDEHQWSESINVDQMPSWAEKSILKLMRNFSDAFSFLDLPGIEFTTSEHFGQLLGAKCYWADANQRLYNLYLRANDASKAKLTEFLGGQEGITDLKAHLPISRKIQTIVQKAFLRVRSQSIIEKGRFFKGFGRGLLVSERMLNWSKALEGKEQKRAYMNAYIFIHWQEITEDAKSGGWSLIHQRFQNSLPKDTRISEDSFEKVLKRMKIGRVGKVGRPIEK